MAKKGGQVAQLRAKLNDINLETKQEAIRRIIDAMTRGKDVSMLFMDVVKNMETPSLQLKKLIYLYIMSYAKSHPDLAILGINTLRKDAVDKSNPFLRGLAVRTMGCIRIKDITEYLCDPLKKALKDEDPYVRKTGALCVPKLYEVSPELVFEQGFLKLLQNLLNDGNASVVSNAVASLSICSQLKGQPLITLTSTLVQKLLTAMNDCNQWGAVYILDTLCNYIPSDPQQTENIMERVSSRLAHTNSSVSLSAIRLIIKYMDYLSNPQSIRNYNNKISAPLISMITREESQISYLVLKTINLVLQKRPLLLPKQLEVFFVNYHDPLYVKMEKLQVLSKIANNQNILMILHHFKECVQEVDVEFVRKAVRMMGRCAIKLEKMADKCVQCLWETLKSKVTYVLQEAVIVIRDIFRKYPNKYEGLLADICENLKSLDDPEAKASIVWIIGEYVEMIQNADQLLSNFSQNFKDEPDVVQHQILVSCMKLYLHKPSEGQQILKDIFKYITKECENPDLRDRGFIYWRLISTNPKLAKSIVLKQRPLISDQSYTLQTELLESLIQNIGYLSSVYCKQPQDFVKKLKDNANAKEVIEEDAQELLAKVNEQDEQQGEGFNAQKPVSFANNQQSLTQNIPTNIADLLDNTTQQEPQMQQQQPQYQPQHQNQYQTQAKPTPQTNLMDDTDPVQQQPQNVSEQKPSNNNLLDLMGDDQPEPTVKSNNTSHFQTTVGYGNSSSDMSASQINSFATTVNANQSGVFNFFDNNNGSGSKVQEAQPKNIVIPLVEVLPNTETSRQGKYSGLSIKAAFEKQGPKILLSMQLQNSSQVTFNDFALKLNANAFKLRYGPVSINQMQELSPNQTQQLQLELDTQNNQAELSGWPYSIDCALKTIDDVFVFKVPMSLSVAFVHDFQLEVEEYKEISTGGENVKKQEALQNSNNIEEFVERMQNNHLHQVFRKENGNNELMSYGCQLVNGMKLIVDVIFDKSSNSVNIQMTGPNETVLAYFNHSLAMVANL